MCQVTVDVGVLFTASGLHQSHQDDEDCIAALEAMKSAGCTLVLDDEDQITSHYARLMHSGHQGFEWAHEMALMGRISIVRRVRVTNAHKDALGKIGFSVRHEDFKFYARTCAASRDKILITLDPNFFNASAALHGCYGITVYQPRAFKDLPTHEERQKDHRP